MQITPLTLLCRFKKKNLLTYTKNRYASQLQDSKSAKKKKKKSSKRHSNKC